MTGVRCGGDREICQAADKAAKDKAGAKLTAACKTAGVTVNF